MLLLFIYFHNLSMEGANADQSKVFKRVARVGARKRATLRQPIGSDLRGQKPYLLAPVETVCSEAEGAATGFAVAVVCAGFPSK